MKLNQKTKMSTEGHWPGLTFLLPQIAVSGLRCDVGEFSDWTKFVLGVIQTLDLYFVNLCS